MEKKLTTNLDIQGNDAILETPFGKTLSLDNQGIKRKRAINYLTVLESTLRKRVLDSKNYLNSLLLQREEALDILPKTSDDLTISGNDKSVESLVSSDVKLTIDIYNANLKYELIRDRYETLFGEFK